VDHGRGIRRGLHRPPVDLGSLSPPRAGEGARLRDRPLRPRSTSLPRERLSAAGASFRMLRKTGADPRSVEGMNVLVDHTQQEWTGLTVARHQA
jgi:hypothetical protein